MARAFGVTGVAVRTARDLADATRAAVARGGSTVIEVAIDPESITAFRRDSFPHRTAR